MNTDGKNTDDNTSVIATIGPVISSIALIVAVFASSSRPMMKYRGLLGDTKATFGPIHTS